MGGGVNARDFFAALPIPIIQAPMVGASGVELGVAVSNAGGLGSLAGGALSPEALEAQISELRQRARAPFAVNLFVIRPARPAGEAVSAALARLAPWYAELGLAVPEPPNDFAPDFASQLSALVRAAPPAASFTFDRLTPVEADVLKGAGVLVIGTATTVAEARAWAQVGADAICAQGSEAGGHRGNFLVETEASLVGTMALVPAILAAVDLPVIAAGGIMDGRGVAAALALGAAAVQMGTAFLLAEEAVTSPAWRGAIEAAPDDPTRLTRAFSGRHARGIENRFMRELRAVEGEVPAYPVQNRLTQPLRAAAAAAGEPDMLSLWAGQGVRLAAAGPAGALVERWWAEAKLAAEALRARTGPATR
jgi:nitronate monooxygenase